MSRFGRYNAGNMITPVQSVHVKARSHEKWAIVGLVVGLGLFFALLIVVSLAAFRQKDSTLGQNNNLSLAALETTSERQKYNDPTCQVSFTYPANWQTSHTTVPLPGTSLHAVTFDGPAKAPQVGQETILSYICLDAKQYSFEQLLAGNSNLKPQMQSIGNQQWQRLGSFAASTFGDKLLVFYMPFTKYDLKPRPGYEEVFLSILQSVNAAR